MINGIEYEAQQIAGQWLYIGIAVFTICLMAPALVLSERARARYVIVASYLYFALAVGAALIIGAGA